MLWAVPGLERLALLGRLAVARCGASPCLAAGPRQLTSRDIGPDRLPKKMLCWTRCCDRSFGFCLRCSFCRKLPPFQCACALGSRARAYPSLLNRSVQQPLHSWLIPGCLRRRLVTGPRTKRLSGSFGGSTSMSITWRRCCGEIATVRSAHPRGEVAQRSSENVLRALSGNSSL